ncbi:hypothetical protein ASJ81_01695 [Methanosarcina spelaei]|uniref:LysM domain-containing protein n=1 Tax=Methanosarcina spelaei TaxID=1036679 RepID=A0A2A2HMV1_9EURY|nr:LysM peptidoglycan-binding domain-containing protein [Methanosarcina spelaei]PAV10658.1 hypothetical protein ASJ81_01695 [Methanosarcina spelaei]
MSFFGNVIGTIIGQAKIDSTDNLIKSIAEFKSELNKETSIRFFVAGSNGSGHQSTTVHIMMRLVYGFKYSNTIEVYYEEKEISDKPTKDKLINLIPGLTNENFGRGINIGPEGQQASIKFILYDQKQKPGELKKFGFTGGADDEEINYAKNLNTTYFLRLQPLNWDHESKIEFLEEGKTAIILDSLKKKNYFYGASTLAAEDWTPMIESALIGLARRRVELAQILFTKLEANQILLMPVYGIRDDGKMQAGENVKPEVFMFSLLASLLSLAQSNEGLPKKTVLVSFGEITENTFSKVVSGCESFLNEQLSSARQSRSNFNQRTPPWIRENNKALAYVKALELIQGKIGETVGLLNNLKSLYVKDTTTVDELNTLLDNNSQNVLYLQLGGIPNPVFDYFYSKANLPTVFEGQGTAAKAYCYGLPYLQLPKNPSGIKYPSDLVGTGKDGHENFATAIKAIFEMFPYATDIYLENSSEAKTYFQNKVEILSGFIKLTLSVGDTIIKQYMTLLKETYGSEKEDKLLLGIVELKKQLPVGNKMQEECVFSSISASLQSTRLEDLLEQLNKAITPERTLKLLDALPAGGIKTFYSKIVTDDSFLITNAEVTSVYDNEKVLTRISVTGETNSFQLPITVRTFDFTNFPAGLASHGEYIVSDVEAKWDLEGAPWIGLHTPGFSLNVFDNPTPVEGVVFASLKSPASTLSLDFPMQTQWNIEADMEKPYPSIGTVSQLLGGIDPIQNLPAPLNTLIDLGISKIKITYNQVIPSISFLWIKIEPGKQTKWDIFPNVTVQNLSIEFSVSNPGNLSQRKICTQLAGSITVGEGIVSLYATYPNFTIYGNLDSGKIQLSDLLKMFAPNNQIDLKSSITEFRTFVIPEENSFSISGTIEANWPITICGKKLFELEQLCLQIQINGNQKLAMIGAVTSILPGSGSEIEISITTTWQSQDQSIIFEGRQTSGKIPIGALIKEYLGWDTGQELGIDGLGLTIETKTNSYEFNAKTAEPWEIPFPIEELTIFGKVTIGYNNGSQSISPPLQRVSKAKMPVLIIDEVTQNLLVLTSGENNLGPYGYISAEIEWNNIDLLISYNFEPTVKCFEVTWGIFTGEIKATQEDETHYVATMQFTRTTTLGSMIETMVSWATGSEFGLAAPWNVLDKIPLSNLKLIWDFKDKTVKFEVDIGPIDIGFCKINSIGVCYTKEKQVNIELDASFIWGKEIVQWDATKPENTPSPGGSGNSYLDLRLLAMGQHVTIDKFMPSGMTQINTVQDAIKCMEQLPEPKSGEIPAITFDANSSWLFGADFGILRLDANKKQIQNRLMPACILEEEAPKYLLTLQTVFNDPYLYALRIALDGDAAKIFKGLDFQIMYRKLSDNIGVYSAEIALPDIMRYLTIGAYSITLPVFAIDIYSTGDFKVDIGFPWNVDFSRSFSIEAIIAPGIPLVGSGGIYFGKLPQVAATNLPVTAKGQFNPILVFGFGAQLGVGKTVQYGILKAGISLTMFGILEGLLAKWNPYEGTSTDTSDSLQLQGDYYFWMQGTLGIIGKIFGTVDFAVVKADVNITIKMYAQITFAAYEPIPITVVASVDATASLVINLGLFKINLHFSFSVKIKETLTIPSPQDPEKAPWFENNKYGPGRLSGPIHCRLRDHRLALMGMGAAEQITPDWSKLSKPAASASLEGYISFALTVAGDRAFDTGETPDLLKQDPCYVASTFIDSVPAATEHDFTSARKAEGLEGEKDTSFEILAKLVARWAIASIQNENVTPEQVDALVVNDKGLEDLLDYLNNSQESIPIPLQSIEAFLSDQIQLTLSMPKIQGEANAAFFPMPLPLILERSAYGDAPALSYSLDKYNAIEADFISELKDYFDQLAVQVQEESGKKAKALMLSDEQENSVGSFIFTDYFNLIMSQMLQALRSGLRDFKRPIKSGDTGNEIVKWVNDTGEIIQEKYKFTLNDLFEGNANHELNKGCKLILHSVDYTIQAGDTFNSIATRDIYGNTFDALTLAKKDADESGLLVDGRKITYPNRDEYTVSGSVSLNVIADHFKVSLDELLANSNILKDEKLLKPFALITLPDFSYTTNAEDTLRSVAKAYNITIKDLASIDDNGEIKDLFSDSEPYIDLVHLPQFQVGELIKEAQRSKALEHLSCMVSRYYFHGLRLPTDKIVPKEEGMWVTRDNNGVLHLPAAAGLFALTGQQMAIPPLGTDPLTFSITRPSSGLDWIQFKDEEQHDVQTLSLSIVPPAPGNYSDAPQDDYLRIQALCNYATQNPLDLELQSIGPQCMVTSNESVYPLSSSIPYQSSTPITYPSKGTLEGDRPRIWYLPKDMLSLPRTDAPEIDPCPCFNLQTNHYNEVTGKTDKSPLNYYGWTTAIEFTIKRLPEIPVEESLKKTYAYNNTYEIMGASGQEVVLLERIVQSIQDNNAFSQLVLGYRLNSDKDAVLRAETGSRITMGISQVNLSTVTRPPSLIAHELLGAEEIDKAILLNTPTEFIRLLWEASITRAGGFYLYYYDDIDGGLPDLIFNDKDEAMVTLIVIYSPEKPEQKDRLRSYMNSVLIGDPIDMSTNAVVAQTTSLPVLHVVKIGESLNSIATQYYSNLLSIVQNNPEISFTKDATFTLVNGTYTCTEDGIKLADIAKYSKMDETEIKEANPRLDESRWTYGLKKGTPIRLPKSELTVGVSPGGETLQSLANYYGSTPTAIAGENQFVVDLLSAGQSLNICTGPFIQSGSTLPDVQTIGVTRNPLPEIPYDDPSNPDYAKNYLLNLYTILGVSVDGNQDFIESNIGLPLSPQVESQPDNMDKIRAAKPSNDKDLIYSKSILYSKLLSDIRVKTTTKVKPYQSNGRLLQIDYSWYDLFGNRLVTQIYQKSEDGINTKKPILTGYTDSLVGLSQWPSTSAHWTVAASATPDDSFLLKMTIRFVSSPFEKPKESESNPEQILAQLEEKEPEPWQIRARTAFVIYDLLLNQLNDSNGINFWFETSLLTCPVPVPVDQSGLGSLSSLASGTLLDKLTKIRDYLRACCDWTTGPVPIPPSKSDSEITLQAKVNKVDLREEQLFKLNFQFVIERVNGLVEGDSATIPAVKRIATPVTPKGEDNNKPDVDNISLDLFAKNIEDTLSVTGKYTLTVATGVDRFEADAGGSAVAVWIVRLGESIDQAISFSVSDKNPPQIFAPRPISNQLITKKATIYNYESSENFDPEKNELTGTQQTLTFTDIEVDKWVRQLFNDIDDLLSPEYVSSILVIDQCKGVVHPKGISSFLGSFNDQKKALADIAKKLMSPVYKTENTHLAFAQEALRQELLVKLSNFYSTRAAISFSANVKANIIEAGAKSEDMPQLFGNIVWSNKDLASSQITLTSPKLILNTNSDVPLTFLVETSTQTESKTLPLNLSFNGTSIEHQISSVPGIEDYKASTWLDFVRPETAKKLQADLGNFEIPMFERSFPLNPRMDVQTGKATRPESSNLSDLTLWDYTFAYSQDFHYPQDRIYGKVEYNLQDNANKFLADSDDAFRALAQFANARSTLEKYLKESVPGINANTCDQSTINTAAKVLGAFLKMVTDVAKVGSPDHFYSKALLSAIAEDENFYKFYIEEDTKQISLNGETESSKAWVVTIFSENKKLLVNLKGNPYVDIEGYDHQLVLSLSNIEKGQYAYYYLPEDKKGPKMPLTGDKAQVIAKRTLVLPGMQILRYQDAKSTIYIKRNEELVKGSPSNNSFVYQTPEVTFSNPMHPTITSDQTVDIAKLGSSTDEPVKRSLKEHLKVLFDELLKDSPAGNVTIQTEVIYNFSIIDSTSESVLPDLVVSNSILLQPPLMVLIEKTTNPENIENMVSQLADGINYWCEKNKPVESKAFLKFKTSIMSNLAYQSTPLITLTNLFLFMEDIVKPNYRQ